MRETPYLYPDRAGFLTDFHFSKLLPNCNSLKESYDNEIDIIYKNNRRPHIANESTQKLIKEEQND